MCIYHNYFFSLFHNFTPIIFALASFVRKGNEVEAGNVNAVTSGISFILVNDTNFGYTFTVSVLNRHIQHSLLSEETLQFWIFFFFMSLSEFLLNQN